MSLLLPGSTCLLAEYLSEYGVPAVLSTVAGRAVRSFSRFFLAKASQAAACRALLTARPAQTSYLPAPLVAPPPVCPPSHLPQWQKLQDYSTAPSTNSIPNATFLMCRGMRPAAASSVHCEPPHLNQSHFPCARPWCSHHVPPHVLQPPWPVLPALRAVGYRGMA